RIAADDQLNLLRQSTNLVCLVSRKRGHLGQTANKSSSLFWQLQDAKARFSELVKRAREHGPQHVSVRGAPAIVVLSEEEFARLTSSHPSIVDHILEGPPWPD